MRNAFEQEKDRIYDELKGKSVISVKWFLDFKQVSVLNKIFLILILI
jgi:hypothetical protein